MPNCYGRVGFCFCLFVPLLLVCECQAVAVEWVVVFAYLFHCCLSVNAKLLRSSGLLFLRICSIVVCL